MTRRQLVARALTGIGATALLEWWMRRTQPNRVAILMYHRVGPPDMAGPFYADVVGPSAEVFGQQIAFLAHHCNVLSLKEYLDRREAGKALPPRSAVITVDDGYADCYTTIYPILKRHGVTGTIFLPTGYLDRPNLFWWDRLACMVSRCERREVILEQPRPLRLVLNGAASREAAAVMLVNEGKALPHGGLEGLLAHVAERTGVRPDESLALKNYLITWEQVRRMAADGIGFGAHTVTHPLLSRVTPDQARWEVQESKRRLERELGHSVDAFCYPSGEDWAYDPAHKAFLGAVGFRCAVTSVDGFNGPESDPFALARITAGPLEDPATLRVTLTGALKAVARMKNRLTKVGN